MERLVVNWKGAAVAGLLGLAAAGGWGRGRWGAPSGPAPLGTLSNQFWRLQEHNAEASDFVVYEHEWEMDGTRLNWQGEDHVKQIAARLHAGVHYPVLVERCRHARRQSDRYKYPVHLNPQLDMRRREVIVQALTTFGIAEADQRVVVSPALTEGLTSPEAERAYLRGLNMDTYGTGFGGGSGGGRFGGFGF